MSDNTMLIMGVLMLLVGCTILAVLIRGAMSSSGGQEWYQGLLKELDLKGERIVIGYSKFNHFLLYTEGDYIYYINQNKKVYDRLNKNKILDVSIDVYKYERNVKRLIALTSTFDKNVIISDVVLKITTRTRTYSINCLVNGRDNNNVVIGERSKIVDDANRIKLLIEDDVKKLNKTNI